MSINDSKKYYFLKLKKGFFQQHQIKILKSWENGRISALIYMELLDESITHNGELRFSENLPYDIPTISAVIDESEEDVKLAIDQFIKLELIEILEDGTYKLPQLELMVGSETNASKRMREQRANIERTKSEQVANKKRTLSENCSPESRVKSIDIRYIEEDIEKKFAKIKKAYLEVGKSEKELEEIKKLLLKEAQKTKIILSSYRIHKITDYLLDADVVDKQGYIYKCYKNERG